MTQPHTQPSQPTATQPAAASTGFAASFGSLRTVAVSLLVDRALAG
ncbi:hypothetical protein [Paraburkholderia sp.]|nr:hypothetical protein [Paraburkholderia sp.]MDE1183363.1 hypothetical protein [Paraburkholderia sp.]